MQRSWISVHSNQNWTLGRISRGTDPKHEECQARTITGERDRKTLSGMCNKNIGRCTDLRAELHGSQGAGEVLWCKGHLFATRRLGSGGHGAHDRRGEPDGLLYLSDGVFWDFVDRRLREKSHHGAIGAVRVDNGRRLGARVDRAGRVG